MHWVILGTFSASRESFEQLKSLKWRLGFSAKDRMAVRVPLALVFFPYATLVGRSPVRSKASSIRSLSVTCTTEVSTPWSHSTLS